MRRMNSSYPTERRDEIARGHAAEPAIAPWRTPTVDVAIDHRFSRRLSQPGHTPDGDKAGTRLLTKHITLAGVASGCEEVRCRCQIKAKCASHWRRIAIYHVEPLLREDLLSAPQSDAPSPTPRSPLRFAVLARELPFLVMLLLGLAGIAYTTFAQETSAVYWEILVPIFAALCIVTGWYRAYNKREHWRLLWTQILHWGAFLAAMQLMFLPGVQRVVNASANGLTILILLALGTFVAGVHAETWQISLVGIVLALGVPAIALVEQSALLVLLAILALIALAWGLRYGVQHLRAKFASPSVPRTPPREPT